MEKELKILIFILIIAFVLRVLFAFSSSVIWWDEGVYADLGHDLSQNPLDYSFNHGWSDFTPSHDWNYMWPKAGFRAPLLPYILSLFYTLKIDLLIIFFMPLIGTLCVFFLYILGKNMFDKKIGLISALFLALIPVHAYFSGRILTDIFSSFFVLLTFICFWKGFEQNKKKYKILFGVFLALALFSRYTVLWIIPIFLIYFLIRDKNIKFLKDKYLWFAVLIFFIIIFPIFIYGYFQYNNVLGAFIHGFKAASYWGGSQPWFFFFQYWFQMFSFVGLFFILSLICIFYKKEFHDKNIYFLLIGVIFFLLVAILMSHKEDRFILPIASLICILSGYFISKIGKYKKVLLILFSLIMIIGLGFYAYKNYEKSYTPSNLCFLNGNYYLKNVSDNSLIVTDESPEVYYYTHQETHFFSGLEGIRSLKSSNNESKDIFVFLTDYGMDLNSEKNILLKKGLDDKYEKVFECENRTFIYKV